MPIGKPRSFTCVATGKPCKYAGCHPALCLIDAAKGNQKDTRAAEAALRAYQAGLTPTDHPMPVTINGQFDDREGVSVGCERAP